MSFEIGFIWVGLMNLISFFIQGCTGFGSTVIAAAVTNGVLGTAVGVPFGTMVTIPLFIVLCLKERKNVAWVDLGKIVLFCIPGLFIGSYLFKNMDQTTAKILIGGLVTAIALMNIYKSIIKPLVLKKEDYNENAQDTLGKKIFRYGCLALGGIVHGAFNIGGPLITVYTIYAVKEKEHFRNTMTWVWLVLNCINAFNQVRNGFFTPRLASALLVGLPFATVGFVLGVMFLKKINKDTFLRIVYCVLLFVGANMFITNLMTIL
ncbi:MAG: sulfite exporter TauE/SafE family protein [Traorella sp.]